MLELRTVGPAAISPGIAAVIVRLGTLGEALQRPDLELLAVVVQDEYTHDIVFETTGQFVVFDAT